MVLLHMEIAWRTILVSTKDMISNQYRIKLFFKSIKNKDEIICNDCIKQANYNDDSLISIKPKKGGWFLSNDYLRTIMTNALKKFKTERFEKNLKITRF